LPLILIALVLGSGLTFIGLSVSGALDPAPARVVIEKVQADAGSAASLDTVVERLRPSIVQIEVTRRGVTSTATGVIYRSDGYVITTSDAVTDADSIRVIFSDGRGVSARVVGIDPLDDIAVLSIAVGDVTPVTLGNPESLAPGTQTIVLNVDANATTPTAFEETVVANGQRFDANDGSTLHDMIATRTNEATFADAILCAPNGAVLGVFTTRSPKLGGISGGTGLAAGSRFATPINFAVQVADEIVATGSVHQAWLGVTSEDVDNPTAMRLGRSGTVLTGIAAGGPAETAGLATGDIIVSIDGAPVTSATNLVVVLRSREIGSAVSISYIRDSNQRTTMATLRDRP
jgi:putative serine protease PepD